MLNYSQAQNEITKFATTETISSAHGVLCGYAIVNPKIKLENWLDEILEEYNSHSQDISTLAQIFNETLENLSDSTLEFHLLVADDDAKTQLISLTQWCSGFLSGLGLAQINVSDDEVEDIIKSMIEISQIDVETLAKDDEADVLEILEFVRMGVLFIQEVVNPSKQDFVSPLPIH